MKHINEIFKNRKGIKKSYAAAVMISSLLIAATASTIVSAGGGTGPFEIAVDGKPLAIVDDAKIADLALDEVKKEITKGRGGVLIASDIKLKPVESELKHISGEAELKALLRENVKSGVLGTVIYIDGKPEAYLKNEAEAKAVVKNVMEAAVQSEVKGTVSELSPVESVDYVEDIIPMDKLMDVKTAERAMYVEEDSKTVHIVKPGETKEMIVEQNDMTDERLSHLNPYMNKNLVEGDRLMVERKEAKINVLSKEISDGIEKVPFRVQTKEDPSLFAGEIKVERAGQNGEAFVKREIERLNGKYLRSRRIDVRLMSEPVDQIVLVGTKDRPPTVATGTFMIPAQGALTSPYGMRNGRMHRGIDIASDYGSPIHATDGGVVTYSGWLQGYGNIVEIDHENGYRSRYAHLSQFSVKVGDRVSQGQEIGRMGSTGYSTGVHLHFEIIRDGVHQNPYPYIYR